MQQGQLGRPLRIAFYGDSNLTLDFLSGELRRILQLQHGDGGHGYVAVGKPWRWYQHIDVHHDWVGEWRFYCPTTLRDRRRLYGSAGIAAATRSPGAMGKFATATGDSPVGKTITRFGAYYLIASKGGDFALMSDGEEKRVVSTQGEGPATGYAEITLPDTAHKLQVVAKSKREIRLFGVVMERDQGVVVDSLGIGGVGYYALAELEPKTTEEMLHQRSYDLVMFLLGTNLFRAGDNARALGEIIALHRKANPNVSFLVMSPPDQVANKGAKHSKPSIVKVSEQLKAAAEDNQVAYWDFREAMGGDASMATFYRHGLAGGDLYHFTQTGAAFMGSRIAHVLWRELDTFSKAQGCAR
ncbi:MAG: GDSL-type esterase/lipase family protein [Polyangiaceae bacterium]